jgi:hypothetical protein
MISPALTAFSTAHLFLAHCDFDKTANAATLGFQIFVLGGLVGCFSILPRMKDRILVRFGLVAIGVLIFELFTAPMWHNYKLGPWAYVYQDVSWILTLGCTVLILSVVTIVDQLLSQWREWKRFIVYLVVLDLVTFPLEIWVFQIGIRRYAPEVLETLSGITIAGVPLEALYYIPVFTGLVIGFYKYWCFVLEDAILVPVKKRHWLRGFVITTVAIVGFELMIGPMVKNVGFPRWSYLFHNIDILMTGTWVLVIAITAIIVSRIFLSWSIAERFVLALMICTGIALPIEYGLFVTGYRVYGESAVHNFSGFVIPVINAPVEIAFAIPCYMALVIAFIRYWEITFDNHF